MESGSWFAICAICFNTSFLVMIPSKRLKEKHTEQNQNKCTVKIVFLLKVMLVLPNPSQLCLQHYLHLENDELTVRCIYIADKWSNAYIPKCITHSHISPDFNIPLQTYVSHLLTAVQLQCSTTPTALVLWTGCDSALLPVTARSVQALP